MSLNGLQGLCIFLVLTIPSLQLNWQASGNMTQSNMTEIQTKINSYPFTSATTGGQFDVIGENIATHLNSIWAPAWNVVVSKGPKGFDTILYGYAFRNHWMWINGLPVSGDNTHVAYLIWKDYNCQTWQHVFQVANGESTFSPAQVAAIQGYNFTKPETDVWLEAFGFVEYLNVQPLLSSGAYTVLMNQHTATEYYGYACMVNTNFSFRMNIKSGVGVGYGCYFMFQTR